MESHPSLAPMGHAIAEGAQGVTFTETVGRQWRGRGRDHA